MIDAIAARFFFVRPFRRIHDYFQLMNSAIGDWRRESQAVFVADELRYLAICFRESFGALGEKDTAARRIGDGQKAIIRGGKALLRLLNLPAAAFFAVA